MNRPKVPKVLKTRVVAVVPIAVAACRALDWLIENWSGLVI